MLSGEVVMEDMRYALKVTYVNTIPNSTVRESIDEDLTDVP